MKYVYAKGLHKGDEIFLKRTGELLSIISIEKNDGKNILIRCSDGNVYGHKEIV